MMRRMRAQRKDGCSLCLYVDICEFAGKQCDYYTPIDYEDRLAEQEVAVMRERFYNEWPEYAGQYQEDDVLI